MLPARVAGPNTVAIRDATSDLSIQLGELCCRLLLTTSSGEEEPEAPLIAKHTENLSTSSFARWLTVSNSQTGLHSRISKR